jgi:hypothetical protein
MICRRRLRSCPGESDGVRDCVRAPRAVPRVQGEARSLLLAGDWQDLANERTQLGGAALGG